MPPIENERLFTRESLFLTVFLNRGVVSRVVSRLKRPTPGQIAPMNLSEIGGEIVSWCSTPSR